MARETNHFVLAEDVSADWLSSAGIPVVPGQPVTTVRQFEPGRRGIRFPVVLKACRQGLLHKTELGAVELGIPDQAGLEAAERRMRACLPFAPERFLVQSLAPDGLEVVLGARRDPVFGVVVLVGMGGVTAELIRDTAIGLVPMSEDKALRLLRSLRGWPLLEGYRGRPRLDTSAVARCLVELSRAVSEDERVLSVDINPVRVYPEGCLALDAVVVIRRDSREEAGAVPVRGDFTAGGWASVSGLDLLRGKRPGDLSPLFAPRSIAVVGVARSPGKAGRVIFENLQRAGFPGAIFPVNPSIERLFGRRCYPRVSDIGEQVDLAILAVPRERIPMAMADAAAAGVRAVIVSSGGFSDAGGEGQEAETALKAQAARLGMRVLGPNSIGIIDPRRGINTSITTLPPISSNRLAVVGQTGLFAAGFAAMLRDEPPFGMGRVVCLGNRADVDESDVLAALADDEGIDAVGLYVEGVRDGPRFRAVASRLTETKALVVLKGGQSRVGAEAVGSHTGSLAGDREVFQAVLREVGAIAVDGFAELFDVLQALACHGRARGRRLGVISVSGAGCVLSADAAERDGWRLPGLAHETLVRVREVLPDWAPARNPLDVWSGIERFGPAETYRRCGEALLSQPDIDALLMAFVIIPEAEFDACEVLSSLRGRFPDKPVYAVLFGGDGDAVRRWKRRCFRAGVPVYTDIASAFRVLGKLSSER